MKAKLLCVTAIMAIVLTMAGFAMAGDTETVAVTATVTGTCQFNSGGAVAFGALDPIAAPDVWGTVTQPAFWCTKNASWAISDDNGVNETGTTHRMLDAVSGDLIPYTFTYTASGTGAGKGTPISMDIASQVLGANYINVSAGSYSDTVTLTIAP